MEMTIHVRLLDEGTDVWRPVRAIKSADDEFTILGPMPAEEQWQYPPGSRVRGALKKLSGGDCLVATDCVVALDE
jgi:hypothetical protein